ncbi:MAG: hypothetical protein OHK0022_10810 [Roseiflexaceae bacterium]
MQLLRILFIAGALVALVAGCGTATGSLPAPTAPPATAVPAPTQPAAPNGVIVTLRVAESETYRILLTDPVDIAAARKLLGGEQGPAIPNGKVVRGDPDVNTGYSWHIDPNSVEFVDMTIEVCDGRPSDVEQQIITSEQFCPWAAKVVAVEDAAATEADAPLVSLKRSGGIAGVSETITVYRSGRVEASTVGGVMGTAQVTQADLDMLRELLASPELAQADSSYKANGADLFTYVLTLPTDGKPRTITTMDGAEHPEIVSKLIAELGRLRPAK